MDNLKLRIHQMLNDIEAESGPMLEDQQVATEKHFLVALHSILSEIQQQPLVLHTYHDKAVDSFLALDEIDLVSDKK